MDEQPSDAPPVGSKRVYTRAGDSGRTQLVGGQSAWKDSARVAACGAVDELNAFTGQACVTAQELGATQPKLLELAVMLRRVQHELSSLAVILATPAGGKLPAQARITSAEVAQLEREMDSMGQNLSSLRSFVLPGGCRLNAELHVCRTVCRRAERAVVALSRQEEVPPEALQYINRLSDAFFVWSRWASHVLGVRESPWEPGQAGSER